MYKKNKAVSIGRLFSHFISGFAAVVITAGFLSYKPLVSNASGGSVADLIEAVPEDEYTIPQPAKDGTDQASVALLSEYTSATAPRCSGSELSWLTCGVYFEARNQSVEGQYWVAQSILNRVEDPRWPNTIEGVIRQGEKRKHGCQYSFMCDGLAERITNIDAWKKAEAVAIQAMEDYYESEPVTCAHSYRASYVTNQKALKWFATLTRDEQVEDHIFYCN